MGVNTAPTLADAPARFAVIADVHGNADALAVVLADIADAGITQIVNLGDHLSGPLAAGETAGMLRAQEGMISIRGNHDRYLLETPSDQMGPSDLCAAGEIGAEDLDWLGAMPAIGWLGDDVFLCHGTPESDERYFLEMVGPDGVVSPRGPEDIATLAEGVAASLILCAHTHTPRAVRLPDGRLIVNPGSVGCPAYSDDTPVPHVVQTGSPDARYAQIALGETGWDVTFRHVPYDPARMVGLAQAAGRSDWAEAVATGWLTAKD